MRQVTQKLKAGKIEITEVPVPVAGPGEVLVRNAYSCISPGTESSTISAARKGYIGKAKDRPEQVRQVLEKLRSQGIVQTYRAVMKKLDAHSPLGYSCSGQVVDFGPGTAGQADGLSVGDRVACGGGSASHAEFVAVPVNLCVKLPLNSRLKPAAYNTLGAIAMQGVRQADVRLGEVCAVIGLGLLGQLTCSILRAAGVKTVGVDVDPEMVRMAEANCADRAWLRDAAGIDRKIIDCANGMGCDSVIITAASASLDPVNFAGSIARKKGTIVVVGSVPTGFDREPHYYQKELTLKMACSYGPGRYDPSYEEKGLDYPYAYVRWTERRNMQAFQELVASGRVDIEYLTTHVFRLNDAPAAYNMILERSEPYAGILIEYDTAGEVEYEKVRLPAHGDGRAGARSVSIGFIGAGSYAQGSILPNIPRAGDIALKGVMTRTALGARSAADRFKFGFCTTRAEDILDSSEINTVFIATRHDSHADYVIRALGAGKHVFVEKPLCLNPEELEDITRVMAQAGENGSGLILMPGYNRRFAPLTKVLKGAMSGDAASMVYRVNAGHIPAVSWIQDRETGGGRVIGEVCHFVDYLTFLNGSLPVSVSAQAVRDPLSLNDTLSILLKYQNGSIGTISYFANGSKSLPKEYIEVHQSGMSAIINDFREISIYGNGKPGRKKLLAQDKGQKEEVRLFLDSVRAGKGPPIGFEEVRSTSLVTFKILESLQSGQTIKV